MKRPLCVACILILNCAPARSDDASHLAKAAEYLRVTQQEAQMRQVLTLITDQWKAVIKQKLVGVRLPEGGQALVAEFEATISKMLADAMRWEDMRPQFVKLAADTYTDEELDGMIAFFKSPVGQSMLTKNLTLLSQTNAIGQSRSRFIQAELDRIVQEFTARGQDLDRRRQQPTQR